MNVNYIKTEQINIRIKTVAKELFKFLDLIGMFFLINLIFQVALYSFFAVFIAFNCLFSFVFFLIFTIGRNYPRTSI